MTLKLKSILLNLVSIKLYNIYLFKSSPQAEREEGRLKDGYRNFKSNQEKLNEQMNSYENNIFKTNKKTEDMRKNMNWDQQVCNTDYKVSIF